MADDDGFDEAFKGFGDEPAPATPPTKPATTPVAAPPAPALDGVSAPSAPPATPPVEPPKADPKPAEEPKKPETTEKPKEEEKKDEQAKPEEKPEEKAQDQKVEPSEKPTEKPAETPVGTPEAPQPLTKDDVKSVVSDLLTSERTSGKELETTTQDVIEKYYPEGLSNTLIDEKSGKELRTPQDVVDASDGEMTIEQAAQWLMNEQYKLDNSIAKIKDDAKKIAETNLNFRRDAVTALQKYEPLFKAYPQLQQKVYDKLMKQVKVDKERNVILSAPDVLEHYDDYLEPYQQAYEFGTKQPATNPTEPTTPEPPKPSTEDRMDEAGDGGASPVDDPNDFAQQVKKELAKEI